METGRAPRWRSPLARCLVRGAERAALKERIDVLLGLHLLDAVFGGELRHEIGLALNRSDVLL